MRCAKCRHSWFEAGGTAEQVAEPVPESPAVPPAPQSDGWDAAEPPAPEPPTPEPDAPEPPVPEPRFAEPESPPQTMPPAPYPEDSDVFGDDGDSAGAQPGSGEWPEAPELDAAPQVEADSEPAITGAVGPDAPAPQGDYAPVAEPLTEEEWDEPAARGKSRFGLILIVLLVILAVAAAAFAAVRYYGAPAWLPTGPVAFAPPAEDLALDFPADQQDRKTLPNGLQFFAASGTVTNTGDKMRHVPDVQVVLRDAQERIVYTWELEPPKRELAPGETLSINEAVTDVPASARVVEIGWKAG